MTRKYSVSLDNKTSEAFEKVVGDRFVSEVIRELIIASLKSQDITTEEPTEELAKLHSKVSEPDFLYEMFTCPITKNTMQVGALPCIQSILGDDPQFECANHVCLGTLKRRLGL